MGWQAIAVALVCLAVPTAARAETACTTTVDITVGSPTAENAVNTALSSASTGDVVCLSAGTATFATKITLKAGVTLRGANLCTLDATTGRPTSCSTVIHNGRNGLSSIRLFELPTSGTGGSLLTRLAHFELDNDNAASSSGNGESIAILAGGGVDSARVDHLYFRDLFRRGIYIFGDGTEQSGLIDHNVFSTSVSGNQQGVAIQGAATESDAPFARSFTPGTNKSWYIEDNEFNWCCAAADSDIDAYGGSRVVRRHNLIIGPKGGVHGADSGPYRGQHTYESYNNTLQGLFGAQFLSHLRSGVGYIFQETYTGTWGYFAPTVYRANPYAFGVGATGTPPTNVSCAVGNPTTCTMPFNHGYATNDVKNFYGFTTTPVIQGDYTITKVNSTQFTIPVNVTVAGSGIVSKYGACDGHSGWDTNSGSPAGYKCLDQVGWLFTDVKGATPTQQPMTIFSVTVGGSAPTITPICGGFGTCTQTPSQYLQADREWVMGTAAFTGASGVGVGPVASRPATCTPPVAYWATDEGTWDSTHSGADGRLYRCTATNTWTLEYTPYTYPHPLTGSAPSSADPTIAISAPSAAGYYDTTAATIDLTGTASDDGSVSSVAWANTLTGGSGSATGTTSWSKTSLSVNAGVNTLTATATDNNNQTATATLRVYRVSVPASPSDSFTASGGWPTLGANWSSQISGAALAIDASQQAYLGTGTLAFSRFSGVLPANNQYAQVALKVLPSNTDFAYVGVRASGADGTWNGYYCGANATQFVPIQILNGVASYLTPATVTWTIVDTLRAEVSGTTFTCKQSGTTRTTNTVTALSAGASSIGLAGAMVVDDFVGGDLSASDTESPVVQITTPTSRPTYVSGVSPLPIAGTASDNTGVSSCTWANDKGGSGSLTGTTSWSGSVTLVDTFTSGVNRITVSCVDAAGNTGSDDLLVIYVTPNNGETEESRRYSVGKRRGR